MANIYEERDKLQKLLDEGDEYIENDMGAVLEVADMDEDQYMKEITEPRNALKQELIAVNNLIQLEEITDDFQKIQKSNLDVLSSERGKKVYSLRNKILENIGAIQKVFFNEEILQNISNPTDFVAALTFYEHDENVTNATYKEGVNNLKENLSQLKIKSAIDAYKEYEKGELFYIENGGKKSANDYLGQDMQKDYSISILKEIPPEHFNEKNLKKLNKEDLQKLREFAESQKIFLGTHIKEAVQGVNDDAPALQHNVRSKPMANDNTITVETINDKVAKISQREILMSYSAKFDGLAAEKQTHITKLISQNESMAELNKKVEPIVKSTFGEKDAEAIMGKLNDPKHKRKDDLALVNTLASEPEKLGKVVSKDMLDMLESQKIVQDYQFHVDKHSKIAVENAKVQGELGRFGKRVNHTVEEYGLEAEYNEYIQAKTPEEKLQTRIVTGYELAQADLAKTLEAAAPEVVAEAVTCNSKGFEVKPQDKLNTHKEVAKFQELAAKNVEKQAKTKTQAKTQSM